MELTEEIYNEYIDRIRKGEFVRNDNETSKLPEIPDVNDGDVRMIFDRYRTDCQRAMDLMRQQIESLKAKLDVAYKVEEADSLIAEANDRVEGFNEQLQTSYDDLKKRYDNDTVKLREERDNMQRQLDAAIAQNLNLKKHNDELGKVIESLNLKSKKSEKGRSTFDSTLLSNTIIDSATVETKRRLNKKEKDTIMRDAIISVIDYQIAYTTDIKKIGFYDKDKYIAEDGLADIAIKMISKTLENFEQEIEDIAKQAEYYKKILHISDARDESRLAMRQELQRPQTPISIGQVVGYAQNATHIDEQNNGQLPQTDKEEK